MKFKLSAVGFLVCLLLLMPTPVFAQPPMPHYFYGKISIGGEPAPIGTVVEARGANVITGMPGNPVSTTVVGQYGSASEPKLYVQGPDIKNGDIIEFYINGAKANETYQFQSDVYTTELDLTIASAPSQLPASFVVADLTVSPAQVEPGETVTIEAEVTNSGGSTGSYTATLKINDAIVDTISITLDPGKSQTVSFAVTEETAGTYIVQLAGLEDTFTVTEPVETPPSETSPIFTINGPFISPAEVDIGGEVTISIVVTNSGEEEGGYTISLKISGVVEETKEITLAGGTSETVTFTTSKDEAGTYSVDVNGLTGSFTVQEKPAPPAPPSKVNWAILGPIIAVVVFLAVFLPIRIRRGRAVR